MSSYEIIITINDIKDIKEIFKGLFKVENNVIIEFYEILNGTLGKYLSENLILGTTDQIYPVADNKYPITYQGINFESSTLKTGLALERIMVGNKFNLALDDDDDDGDDGPEKESLRLSIENKSNNTFQPLISPDYNYLIVIIQVANLYQLYIK